MPDDATEFNHAIQALLERERQGLPTKTKRMEITKSHWLHWYFPTMTPWKPYSRNYDQSWEPSAGSLIRTPWWSFLSWEKFGQNKSQALPKLATYIGQLRRLLWGIRSGSHRQG